MVGLMKDLSWLDNREMMSETEINSPVENSACNTIINVLFARMHNWLYVHQIPMILILQKSM